MKASKPKSQSTKLTASIGIPFPLKRHSTKQARGTTQKAATLQIGFKLPEWSKRFHEPNSLVCGPRQGLSRNTSQSCLYQLVQCELCARDTRLDYDPICSCDSSMQIQSFGLCFTISGGDCLGRGVVELDNGFGDDVT